ncbi:hypothetical protein CGZ91_08670 [Parenemella sanctibonifatiensis]|uniref:ABC transmembrane type-1 domain-containing protein n=1 Tax=Parenemella sanctibonifatiensis TaxID=2016505 RepID=A0A255EGY5_9ACTN|nr:hypothetical protein CGZ91_08670 [Parenemella sanctibonifatiensis]
MSWRWRCSSATGSPCGSTRGWRRHEATSSADRDGRDPGARRLRAAAVGIVAAGAHPALSGPRCRASAGHRCARQRCARPAAGPRTGDVRRARSGRAGPRGARLGIGVLLGLAPAGVRSAVSRAGDVIVIVPPVVVTLVVVLGFGATPVSIVVAVVLGAVVIVVRVLSAATAQLRRAGWVEAASGFGDPPWRIVVRDIVPGLAAIIIAETSLRFLAAIQLVAALSFLGFAAGLGKTWASAIRDNITGFPLNPWASVAPGLALVVCVSGLALVAERAGEAEGARP